MKAFGTPGINRHSSPVAANLPLPATLLITGIVMILAPVTLDAAETTLSFTGVAYNDSDEPIYQEKHSVKGSCQSGLFSPELRQVRYLSAGDNGKEIASKQMIIAQSPLRPSFQMNQPGFNETMAVTNENGKTVAIEWHDPDGETHTNTLDITDDMVFDVGFVRLIQKKWQALNTGNAIHFKFLSPTRADTYNFAATPIDGTDIDAYLTLRMAPESTILGWIVDPIVLGFDNKGRLTDYQGLTNIRRNKDENYTANIHYDVPELPCALVKSAE